MKKYNIFLSIIIVYIIVNMILFPTLYISITLDGITAWAFNVLPSILPFIFFTKILSSTGTIERFSLLFKKPSKILFNTNSISSYAFLMSIVSGYPVGAKITSDLYLNGKITRSDAFKMTSFCSTSGPMFIIGAVGTIMLKNALFGYIIFLSHIIGALLNGILYRNIKVKELALETSQLKNQSQDLSSTVIDTSLSVISIGVIITIFFVVITSLSPIFNFFSPKISAVLEGIIEITKGCISTSQSYNNIGKIIACTFIISFGGISTILQSLTMLQKLQMPISLFISQKFTHACFSTIIASIFCLFI